MRARGIAPFAFAEGQPALMGSAKHRPKPSCLPRSHMVCAHSFMMVRTSSTLGAPSTNECAASSRARAVFCQSALASTLPLGLTLKPRAAA